MYSLLFYSEEFLFSKNIGSLFELTYGVLKSVNLVSVIPSVTTVSTESAVSTVCVTAVTAVTRSVTVMMGVAVAVAPMIMGIRIVTVVMIMGIAVSAVVSSVSAVWVTVTVSESAAKKKKRNRDNEIYTFGPNILHKLTDTDFRFRLRLRRGDLATAAKRRSSQCIIV